MLPGTSETVFHSHLFSPPMPKYSQHMLLIDQPRSIVVSCNFWICSVTYAVAYKKARACSGVCVRHVTCQYNSQQFSCRLRGQSLLHYRIVLLHGGLQRPSEYTVPVLWTQVNFLASSSHFRGLRPQGTWETERTESRQSTE